MAGRRNILALTLMSLSVAPFAIGAPESEAACSKAREHISQLIKEARLKGDSSQRAALEAQLQSLTERCSGVVPLQANHDEIEQATRLATVREAQLREALGTGDPQVIEISKRRLDQARKQLDAAKR
ncbi:DUF1090 family protein [Stutzerimonas zhaodongensis]|uniref:DUF1090 family protein n=1 Tax=Stutzerimonas TaxID=2901164 RepID=UPI003890875D